MIEGKDKASDLEQTPFVDSSVEDASGGKGRLRQLGRGLSSLLGDDTRDYADLDRSHGSKSVPIEFLTPGRFQPRHRFDPAEIDDLAASISARGLLQPILVRRHAEKIDQYEIVAGERRWRAAQAAGLHEVPVTIRELDDAAALEIALVENLQRKNLTPIEEATAYRRLMDEFSHTQEALAQAVGRSRSHIANSLRLLTLPENVKAMVEDGRLTAGHARALVGSPQAEKLARDVVRKDLNVRQIERLIQQERKTGAAPVPGKSAKDTDTLALEQEISEVLGLRVSIRHRGTGGVVAVTYATLEQLEMLLAQLSRVNDEPEDGETA